jgi:hypothetical protein
MAISFLKRGADSVKLAAQEEAAAQKRREEAGKMFRFWLGKGEEARITFVDGDLDSIGRLLPPRFYEHNLLLNGEWNNYFVCTERTNPEAGDPCVICPAGDRPSLMALFTVIDHRSYQSKDKTKTYVNRRKILAAKPDSFEILYKIAQKRGGLACCTFDVSRMGDKSPNVGSMFDFVEKNDLDVLQGMYTEVVVNPKTNVKTVETYFKPANYEEEIVYRTSAELIKLGLGAPTNTSPVMSPAGQQAPVADYAAQL